MSIGFLTKAGKEAQRGTETPHIRTRNPPTGKTQGIASTKVREGDLKSNLPAEVGFRHPFTGYISHSFFNDYYNTVHLIPDYLDFGPVSGKIKKRFYIWNTYTKPISLNAVTPINAEGVRIVEGPVSTYVPRPLELIPYMVEATPAGPVSIEGHFLFSFSDGGTRTLLLRGVRGLQFLFPPNWSKSLYMEYRFKTEVVTSWSGKEQRQASRMSPRKNIRFEACLSDADLRELNRMFVWWQSNSFMVPDHSRIVELSCVAREGDAVVTIMEEPPEWLIQSASVVLLNNGVGEVVSVDSVDGGTIRFTAPLTKTWEAGSALHPAMGGRMGKTIQSRQLTSTTANIQVSFDVTPASEPVLQLPPPPSFEGVPVFDLKPDWGEVPQMEYESSLEKVDFGIGLMACQSTVPFNSMIKKYTFSGKRAHMLAVLQHFIRMKGKRGEFYMPTFESDIEVVSAEGRGTRAIEVKGPQFYNVFSESTTHRAICIQHKDGSYQNNRVVSIIKSGPITTIRLKDPISRDIGSIRGTKISWLLLHRYASDNLTIEWMTNAAGRCHVPVQTLEDLN